jgi:hypothetical protein
MIDDKTFAGLSAAFALEGLQLYRSDRLDGPVRLFFCRHGWLHQLASIDDAKRVLALIPRRSERREVG